MNYIYIHTPTMKYYSDFTKEGNPAICDMSKTGEFYAK